jgi:hypothetical protein
MTFGTDSYGLFDLERFLASGVLLPLGGEDRC